ncbi:MAG: hypothetical protein AB1758_09495 [Candidatus Eremiobacterota bacterium]
MLSSLGNLWRTHVGYSSDYSSDRDDRPALVAAGWTVAATGIGAAIGAARHARDVVTVEQVPYAESYRVPVGSHTETGCYDYHFGYNPMSGEFEPHYGYNASCTQTVTDYETRFTGKTLYREVHHHSVGFPNTVIHGVLLGFGVGVATSAAGLLLYHVLKNR